MASTTYQKKQWSCQSQRRQIVWSMKMGKKPKKVAVVDFAQFAGGSRRLETRATMLFLVVVCLEISDILFAVDSVSAIVAQVNDLFLAYTSAVFAMLGLRATFFIVDEL